MQNIPDTDVSCSDIACETVQLFKCGQGHSWKATIKNFNKHLKCPFCNKLKFRVEHTSDNCKLLLNERGFTLIGEMGPRIDSEVQLICPFGHIFTGNIMRILRYPKYKCWECSGKKRLTIDDMNNRLRDRNILMLEKGKNVSHKAKFKCLTCNHIWNTKPDCVLNSLSGCPGCSVTGFNDSKPGKLYINIINIDGREILKIGITNGDASKRSKFHVRHTCLSFHHHCIYEYHKGSIIRELESRLKIDFNSRRKVLTKQQLPDGYTETFDISILYEVQKYINDFQSDRMIKFTEKR